MKKIALFLAISIVLLHIQIPVLAQSEEYSVEAETLFQLNIADKEVFYKTDNQIKRADFAMLAAALRGYKGDMSSVAPFIDINEEYYAAGSIAYLKNLGILSGYDDGTFRGEKPITYLEATITLIKILGYNEHARSFGDGLSRYIKMAQNIDLDDGIYLAEDAILTQKDAFKLIYNALEIPVGRMQLSSGTTTYVIDNDAENAMSMWLCLDKVSGVVKNVGYDAITWDCVGVGGMTVGNRQLFLSDGDNFYYGLGKYCDVYYYNGNDDREEEVAAVVILPNRNDEIEINTEDVISFNNGILTYQKEGKSSRNIRINVNDDISLNGVPVPAEQRENALLNADGKIIINKIGSSDIDSVVMIESYQTCFVTAISNDDDIIIYGKYGNPIVLDENDPIVVYDEFSNLSSIENISINDVLTVKSGAELTEIHICRRVETGRISGISNEDQNTYVSIGDMQYTMTKEQRNNMSLVKLGDNVTLYFDMFDRIAYIMATAGNLTYAYLYDLIPDEFEEEMFVRLYTASGVFEKYTASDKLRIDGERITDNDDIYTKLERGTQSNGYRQIVRYALNAEGKINNIDTLYKGTGETDNSLHIMHKGYTDAREESSKLVWKPRGGSFEGKVLYNSSVKFLTVPKEYNGDKDYFFSNKVMKEDDQVAFNAYASSEGQLMPDVLLSYIEVSSGAAAARVSETFLGVVTDVKIQLNSDDEVETRISFDTYGGAKDLVAHEDFDEDKIVAYSTTESVKDAITKYDNGETTSYYELERGDFAEITVDSLNRVIFARAIVKGSTGENLMDKNEAGSIYNHRFAYGFMYKNERNVFAIATGDKSNNVSIEDLRYYNTGTARVYRVNNARKITVDKISIADILDYNSATMGADKVVVYTMAGISEIILVCGE